MHSVNKLNTTDINWVSNKRTQAVINALRANGQEIRFVGGSVRDTILKREVTDIDIATPDVPDKVISLLKQANIKFIPTCSRPDDPKNNNWDGEIGRVNEIFSVILEELLGLEAVFKTKQACVATSITVNFQGPTSFDDVEFDYKTFYNELSELITNEVEFQLKDYVHSIEYFKLNSPKYYNYSNQ